MPRKFVSRGNKNRERERRDLIKASLCLFPNFARANSGRVGLFLPNRMMGKMAKFPREKLGTSSPKDTYQFFHHSIESRVGDFPNCSVDSYDMHLLVEDSLVHSATRKTFAASL